MNENAGDSNSIFGRAAGTAMGIGLGAAGVGAGGAALGWGADIALRGRYNKETGKYATGKEKKVKNKKGASGGDNIPTVEAEVVTNMDEAVGKMKNASNPQLEGKNPLRLNPGVEAKQTANSAGSIIYASGEVADDYAKNISKLKTTPNLLPAPKGKGAGEAVKKIIKAAT